LTARITTSCGTRDTRYTRLNLLGWSLLCPHARDIICHGSSPLQQPDYPTADESKRLHEELKDLIGNIIIDVLGDSIISSETEHEHEVGVLSGDCFMCAKSKADLVYTIKAGKTLSTLYIEASSRINVAKPWQALLRGIALYYERRLPVGVVIVSPGKIMYKLISQEDQDKVLKMMDRVSEYYTPNPNLCSLCELANYCPFKAI